MTISFSKEQQEAGRLYEHALSILSFSDFFSDDAVAATITQVRSMRCTTDKEREFANRLAQLIHDIHNQ